VSHHTPKKILQNGIKLLRKRNFSTPKEHLMRIFQMKSQLKKNHKLVMQNNLFDRTKGRSIDIEQSVLANRNLFKNFNPLNQAPLEKRKGSLYSTINSRESWEWNVDKGMNRSFRVGLNTKNENLDDWLNSGIHNNDQRVEYTAELKNNENSFNGLYTNRMEGMRLKSLKIDSIRNRDMDTSQ
jgi:hypothetical protein